MKVVFTENLKNVAQAGDIKEVRPGFARNFLFPQNMAVPATKSARAKAEELKKRRLEQEAENLKQAREQVKLLGELVLEIEAEANDSGVLYAGINEEIISNELLSQKINIKPEHINLAEPIKQTGEHEVEIELHPEVKTKIKVVVKAAEEK